ncbi:GNAT family N-acetyltransferase [Candidatus Bathyarchaeota archaeon]|jgi:ribosomal protein S18 acetylase RimI-like enzyme|nr:GNAT family N-acetyltransferase [Candidatus Bathyarchaeota archaeon]
MPEIRRYESRDFVDYAATLEKTSTWERKAAAELKARLEKLTRREQVWVAEVGTRGVGFMILSPNNDGSLEVDWLDVHPDFQRTGIGTLLVEKAAKIAKAKKMKALSVHTWETNQKMLDFSAKNGFQVLERIKGFYGRGKDALRLKKEILP